MSYLNPPILVVLRRLARVGSTERDCDVARDFLNEEVGNGKGASKEDEYHQGT
jgi:hypothetical protein